MNASHHSIGAGFRGFLVRDGAINGFVSTGNRMLPRNAALTHPPVAGPLPRAICATIPVASAMALAPSAVGPQRQ